MSNLVTPPIGLDTKIGLSTELGVRKNFSTDSKEIKLKEAPESNKTLIYLPSKSKVPSKTPLP